MEDSVGETPSFVTTLRGRRRKLGEMTRDEEREFKLQGFRFCPWLERWRLATTVMRVPCGVTFAPLARFGREAPRVHPPTSLTTLQDVVLTDKRAIYDALAAAATVCEGWMTRLSDADIAGHIETVDELSEALAALLGCNTKVGFESALAAVLRLLQHVENNADLARFVRNYRSASEGTHFLDAFYAPLLLRLHIVNEFLAGGEGRLVDLSGQFPVLHMWLQKVLSWALFAQVLGTDFATELTVYYKDRGSYVFNSRLTAPGALAQHCKYVPAVFLREQRFAVCAKLVARPTEWASVLRVVETDSRALQKGANVEIRLQSLHKLGAEQSPKFPLVFETIADGVHRIRGHLLDSLTLTQLWQMEAETWVELSRHEEALAALVAGVVQHQPREAVVTLVEALVEMVLIGHNERELKDVLQMLYRECNPSDWVAVCNRMPLAMTVVLTKENWAMHHKFPAVSLLCSFYSLIKRRVLALHDLLCPATGAMDAPIASLEEVARQCALLKRLTVFLHAQLLVGNYGTLVSPSLLARWSREHTEVLLPLFEAFEAQLAQQGGPKRVRLAWKKLKRDLVLHLRNQKKCVIPKMLRFVNGEALVAAQLKCLADAAQTSGTLELIVPELEDHSDEAEFKGVFNVLRSSPAHETLYRQCLSLLRAAPGRRALVDSGGPGDDDLSWHPKFAGVPFILGLANRVMMEDLGAVVRASERSLKGLGELPTTDIRNTFEIFYAHFISHKSILFEPVVESLGAQSCLADHAALEPQMERLEELVSLLEKTPGLERRRLLQDTLEVARRLHESAARFFGGFSRTYVPVCVAAFSFEQSMELFGHIVQTYHKANPHLLCRTIASLREDDEFHFFCRNILSVSFHLLKDVLDTVRAEVPTRIWLRVTQTMPCLAGVTLDAPFWPELPNGGGVALFWKLSHRHIESEMAGVLVGINDRLQTPQSFLGLLNTTQRLMMYLEKHGNFEDEFLLPRIACAVPTIAEASYEDTANEHALLESNELRVISILRASFKAVQQEANVVPLRQVNRMKRQLRSYQTLILPHLCKEEEKYYPLMLFRFSPMQLQTLFRHLLLLYGKLLSDDFIMALLRLATPAEQRRFVLEFLPNYLKACAGGGGVGGSGGGGEGEMVVPSSEFYFIEQLTMDQVAVLCARIRPKLWASLQRSFPSIVAPE